ncbi:hypothetical protein [Amaricoccus sp.]|uniref:hypothetical protein n=1 Tax=Amaricoccus sp. TaxID=1872485 RepID=UPI001B6DE4DB|nr:hypothetical protein [Amaricoccus sp.]MBP7000317.1 hypothetical protein [Amaricoccus sp.]
MTNDAYDEIAKRYEAELRGVIPSLLAWWERIAENNQGGTSRELRWPMGPCSHPRFIEIFRRYYLEIQAENEKNESDEEAVEAAPITDDMWGAESAEDEEGAYVNPNGVLLAEMISKDSKLKDFLGFFVFIPVDPGEY